jgi:hypothetical protein
MTKRQHIGNQIDAAMILARAECVSVTDNGSPEGRTPFRSALTTVILSAVPSTAATSESTKAKVAIWEIDNEARRCLGCAEVAGIGAERFPLQLPLPLQIFNPKPMTL